MAEQIIGNSTNTLIMMRVADQATAELMTQRLDRVEVNALMLESGVTDSSDPDSTSDFVSGTRSRISSQVVSLLDPAHLMKLPKGQAFVLMEGGRLYKVRFPLPDPRDAALPADVAAIAADMHRRYRSDVHWADFDPSCNPAALEGRA